MRRRFVTPNRERQCIGCWLCESPTRCSHSERQCKVVQIRVLVGDAWVRTYSFQADFKAITYQSPCDAVHAVVGYLELRLFSASYFAGTSPHCRDVFFGPFSVCATGSHCDFDGLRLSAPHSDLPGFRL